VREPDRLSAWRDRVNPLEEWPHGAARFGVVCCVALSVVLGLVYAVQAIHHLGDGADRNAALNYDDREFGGGNSLVVDKSALYEARALIPEDETYRVVTGPRVRGASELTEPYIDQYARYFLMPRRPAADARWLLCYGCDLTEYGDRLEILWKDDSGIALVRLQ
jgi:hypothetical protein